MNDKEKKSYLEKYKEAKEKGVPFFPDIIFKDTVIVLVVFLALVALAYFVGAPVEARANPNDTNYTPRPEWYFLFLFQMLKYFPGNLEVIGAMVLPGLFIVLLFLLPFIDKSPKRHFLNRPFASISAVVVVLGIGALTVLSVLEAPPPQQEVVVDQAAALYSANCANCHGSGIAVQPGTDLHAIIASGTHQGMPAWGGDLSTDEIDLLVGFILSPNGDRLYSRECETCHEQGVLASGNPIELQRVLVEGPDYPAHQGQGVPQWSQTLSAEEHDALLNFLAAPDGQRLFVINCADCHGQGVAFSGSEEELRSLIAEGGQHLAMPAWKGTLSEADLNTLAAYVSDPEAKTDGATLFGQHCASCHGDRVPSAPDLATARKVISGGGAHVTMPVWGEVLTKEQLDALTAYTYSASQGGGAAAGARLFVEYCSACHGQFGQGGPNPSLPGDIIPPISSAEYLKTRDDSTLRSIIEQGQPNFGMSPFGSAYGGPLSDEEIDAILSFIRGWQDNPPVDQPPTVTTTDGPVQPVLTSAQVYAGLCAGCHGNVGEGGSGPALNTQEFLDRYDEQTLFDTINNGHPASAMIAWSDVLTAEQIQQLVGYVRALAPGGAGAASQPSSFSAEVLPILKSRCQICHSAAMPLGGWDSSSYATVTTTGTSGSVVIAGDTTNSLLVKRLLGLQGGLMPPSGKLSDSELQVILNWIAAGALDN